MKKINYANIAKTILDTLDGNTLIMILKSRVENYIEETNQNIEEYETMIKDPYFYGIKRINKEDLKKAKENKKYYENALKTINSIPKNI